MLVTPKAAFKVHDNRFGAGANQSELPLPRAGAATQAPARSWAGLAVPGGNHVGGLAQQGPAIELWKYFPPMGLHWAPVTLSLGHPCDGYFTGIVS